MTFLLATNNPGKAKEIKPLFQEAGLSLITLADLGLSFEPKEDGETFLDNATQKARETTAFLKEHGYEIPVIADDSGLCIDALGGEPGVHSALFMGRDTPYPIRCQSILEKLGSTHDEWRSARFICTLVCVFPHKSELTASGTVEGRIAWDLFGDGGFGYDPIFYYPPFGKTLAEMSKEEKNQISHRGQAIQKMIGLILDANFSTQ